MESKVCTKCRVEKSLESFSNAKYGKYGKASQCKGCCSKYFRRRYLTGGKEKALTYQINNKKIVKANVDKYQSKMQPGVYRLWTEDGDYIGESIKMERRVWNHKEWNDKSPVNKPILGWEVLEVIHDEIFRKKREIYWIKKLKPTLNSKDYHWGSSYVK